MRLSHPKKLYDSWVQIHLQRGYVEGNAQAGQASNLFLSERIFSTKSLLAGIKGSACVVGICFWYNMFLSLSQKIGRRIGEKNEPIECKILQIFGSCFHCCVSADDWIYNRAPNPGLCNITSIRFCLEQTPFPLLLHFRKVRNCAHISFSQRIETRQREFVN